MSAQALRIPLAGNSESMLAFGGWREDDGSDQREGSVV